MKGRGPYWLSLRLPFLLIAVVLLSEGMNFGAAVKILIGGATYLVLVSEFDRLVGRLAARIAGGALIALIGVAGVFEPFGRFDLVVPEQYSVTAPQVLRTRIYTFPDSDRWNRIANADAQPYLYVGSPTELNGDMIPVRINGEDMGRLQEMPDIRFGSGSWAAPLS